MAENIVAGLFGLNPQMYGEQQRRGSLREGIELAQLDPASRGAALTYAGARGLGGAIAGAMGIEDPQLKLISARNAIAQQIDQSNPESILQGAQMLAQAGDQQGAMALAQYARQAQSEMAQTQQRKAAAFASIAQATREKVQASPKEVQLAKEVALLSGPEGSPEYNTAYAASLTGQISKDQKEKLSAFGQTLVDAGLTPGTEPFQKRMLEYANEKLKGAAKGTGNVTIGGINVDTGAASKKAGEIIGTNVANIEQQFSLKTAFDDAIKLVNQGIYAGAYGPERQFAAKFAGIGSPQKVENTEVFMSNIGEIVIPRLQQFGGNDSNEELKYLQKVVAGELRMEPKAMLRVLESAEKKTRNNIERLQKQVSTSGKGEPLPVTPMNATLGSPQNPIKLKDK
jgi:hypothetical protein